MRVEEMALRSEIRQMLNEAGFNKNTLVVQVKSVLHEEVERAIKQAINETDFEGMIEREVRYVISQKAETHLRDTISKQIVGDWFNRMKVDVQIETKDGSLIPKKGDEDETEN